MSVPQKKFLLKALLRLGAATVFPDRTQITELVVICLSEFLINISVCGCGWIYYSAIIGLVLAIEELCQATALTVVDPMEMIILLTANCFGEISEFTHGVGHSELEYWLK